MYKVGKVGKRKIQKPATPCRITCFFAEEFTHTRCGRRNPYRLGTTAGNVPIFYAKSYTIALTSTTMIVY